MSWIYISPHLDDAVFSCGGLIAGQTGAGERVEVCTVFTGDAVLPLSPFAMHMHGCWGLKENAPAIRRGEDALACHGLGATWRHLDFPDAMYRRHPQTRLPLYPTDTAIFGVNQDCENGFPAFLARILSGVIPQGAKLAVPIGLGRHVDHLLVRRAVEKIECELLYYEDVPYALNAPSDRDRRRLQDAGWTQEIRRLTQADVEAWEQAIVCYASQLHHFWPEKEMLRQDLMRQINGFDGLRLWHPPTGRTARGPAAIGIKALLVAHPGSPVSPVAPMGGGASSMVDLARALQRSGCRVTVAGMLVEKSDHTHEGVVYRHLGRRSALVALLTELAADRIDVVYADRGFILARAGALLPDAIRVFGAVDFFPRAHGVDARQINQVAHRVIAVSQYIADRIAEWGVAPGKVVVLPEGIDTDIFHQRADVSRERGLVMYAGATVPGKGLIILLQAFALLARRLPGARLEIYGSSSLWGRDGEFLDWDRITNEQPAISYLGARSKSELAIAYNRASACVVPTIPKLMQEGFTRVSLEAQACGCPVVVSRSGGLPETIVPGETGRVVDPIGAQVLADALFNLLANDARWGSMSLAAASHAGRFTTQRRARGFLDALHPRGDELPFVLPEVG